MKYSCDICKFHTNRKSNIHKHDHSYKHKCNLLSIDLDEKNKLINEQNNFINNLENDKMAMKEDILNKEQHIKQLETEFIIKELESENKIKDVKIDGKDQQLNQMKQVYNNSNKLNQKAMSNMKYIATMYKDAPGISFPRHVSFSRKEILKILGRGPIHGSIYMLEKLYVNGVPAAERCTWCIDVSRSKYFTKDGDTWKPDMYGRKIIDVCFNPMVKILTDFVNKEM